MGKLRHVDTQALWVQSKVKEKTIELRKVRGDSNPADLLTKPLDGRRILALMRIMGLRGGALEGGETPEVNLLAWATKEAKDGAESGRDGAGRRCSL